MRHPQLPATPRLATTSSRAAETATSERPRALERVQLPCRLERLTEKQKTLGRGRVYKALVSSLRTLIAYRCCPWNSTRLMHSRSDIIDK